jgi:putative inorganic carbon (HCO3(-)) transporter
MAGLWAVANWATDHQRLVVSAAALVVAGGLLALLSPLIVNWDAMADPLTGPTIYSTFPPLLRDAVHPNTMASLMATLLPLPLSWLLSLLRCRRKSQQWAKLTLMGGACLVMGLSLILTRSRGGYASALVGGIMVILLSVRKSRRFVFTVALGLIGSCAWIALARQWDPPRLLGEITDPSTLHFRLEVWKTALLIMSDFPFTGVGMGAFNFVASALYGFRAPSDPGTHSLFLQAGVDLGCPGLIAVLALLVSSGWMALRTMAAYQHRGEWELRAITLGVLSGLAAMSLHGLVDNTVWGTRATIVPWLMMGLATALFLGGFDPIRDHRPWRRRVVVHSPRA